MAFTHVMRPGVLGKADRKQSKDKSERRKLFRHSLCVKGYERNVMHALASQIRRCRPVRSGAGSRSRLQSK